jgi:hypothetical protein
MKISVPKKEVSELRKIFSDLKNRTRKALNTNAKKGIYNQLLIAKVRSQEGCKFVGDKNITN